MSQSAKRRTLFNFGTSSHAKSLLDRVPYPKVAAGQVYFGRTGLMIRDSLDPFARNVFVSHSPFDQADWSIGLASIL